MSCNGFPIVTILFHEPPELIIFGLGKTLRPLSAPGRGDKLCFLPILGDKLYAMPLKRLIVLIDIYITSAGQLTLHLCPVVSKLAVQSQ
jgi:hypothetical protein